jgi:PhnB protein
MAYGIMAGQHRTLYQVGTMNDRANLPAAPEGYSTVNPFIITEGADGLIEFLQQVFGATERPEARTIDGDGLLLHAELVIGDTTVMFADRKPDWPFTPSLLQVYVDDLDGALDRARRLKATVVTQPTEFYGDLFSRVRDPWNNLWWVYQHRPSTGEDATDWSAEVSDADGEAWDQTSPELQYIHDTLLTALPSLEDPRLAGARVGR